MFKHQTSLKEKAKDFKQRSLRVNSLQNDIKYLPISYEDIYQESIECIDRNEDYNDQANLFFENETYQVKYNNIIPKSSMY